MKYQKLSVFACALAMTLALGRSALAKDPSENPFGEANPTTNTTAAKSSSETSAKSSIHAAEIPPFVKRGITWLIAAQNKDGGWGSGSLGTPEALAEMRKGFEAVRANLGVAGANIPAYADNAQPRTAASDPGTTAFVLMALLRAGNSPIDGEYKEQVRRGLNYLLKTVADAPAQGPLVFDNSFRMQTRNGANITPMDKLQDQVNSQYTQPRMKLGAYVDTPLAAQYLGRAIGLLPKTDSMYRRVSEALDKCIFKLQLSQHSDGSWGMQTGWAPVLQSSLSCSALEIAQANGKKIDEQKLERARAYQKNRVDALSGSTSDEYGKRRDGSAGIELYAFNAAFRGNASEARQAESALNEAKYLRKLPKDARPTREILKQLGFSEKTARTLEKAATQNAAQTRRLDDEKLLSGFGMNGGEEYLSYLLTSESLVIAGGDKFDVWNDKIQTRLAKLQNSDGSWSGSHCITSSVFSTAAVVQCLTTGRDAEFLTAMAEKAYSRDNKIKARPTGGAKAEVAEK